MRIYGNGSKLILRKTITLVLLTILVAFTGCFEKSLSLNNSAIDSELVRNTVGELITAAKEDNVQQFSNLLLNDQLEISRRFASGNYNEVRGEEIHTEEINSVSKLSSLNFEIGAKKEIFELNVWAQLWEPDIDNIKIVQASSEFWKQDDDPLKISEDLMNYIEDDYFGSVIFMLAEDNFVLSHYCGSGLAYSDWCYFEKQGKNDYKLRFVMLVY